MDFKLKTGEQVRTRHYEKASATVIEAGDFIALDANGLAIKATAASTKIAWCPNGAAAGEVICEASIGNDFTLKGAGDAVFAESMRGSEVDIVVTSTVQLVDVGASATDVLRIVPYNDAGTVGSTANIEVRINKPLD